MNLFTFLLAVLTIAVLPACHAQHQYGGFYDSPGRYFFRHGNFFNRPLPSFGEIESRHASKTSPAKADARFWFTTLTLSLTSTTTTSTFTTTTICTLSTATLSTCTPGRRRRGLNGRVISRGLFYNDEEKENDMDNIFVPSFRKLKEPAKEIVEEASKPTPEAQLIPFIVQPGFRAPDVMGSGRFLLAWGTSTITTSTTSTYTFSLTALCSSSTSWSTCGGSGK